jgi:hypothetical protein
VIISLEGTRREFFLEYIPTLHLSHAINKSNLTSFFHVTSILYELFCFCLKTFLLETGTEFVSALARSLRGTLCAPKRANNQISPYLSPENSLTAKQTLFIVPYPKILVRWHLRAEKRSQANLTTTYHRVLKK